MLVAWRNRWRVARLKRNAGVHLWKFCARNLSANGARHAVNQHKFAGHHVRRKRLGQRVAQCVKVRRRVCVAGDNVRNNNVRAFISLHAARGFKHAIALTKQRINGRKFHAVAAQFHLAINATKKFKVAACGKARQIARAINAAKLWMIDKFFRRHLWTIAIAARHANAADAEFALHASWNLLQRLVQNVRGVTNDGLANGDRKAAVHARAHHGHGAFGGAVTIFQPATVAP